jgi:hypothetical protein
VSCGDNPLMASQNRCASAIRSVLGAGTVEGLDWIGDMMGVRGGVANPWDTAGVDTDTVAMTWFNKTPLHRLYRASPT